MKLKMIINLILVQDDRKSATFPVEQAGGYFHLPESNFYLPWATSNVMACIIYISKEACYLNPNYIVKLYSVPDTVFYLISVGTMNVKMFYNILIIATDLMTFCINSVLL